MTTKSEIEALCEMTQHRSANHEEADILFDECRTMLRALADENEQYREHRSMTADFVMATLARLDKAEARAIAAEEALKPFAYAAFEADGYPDNEAFTIVLRPDNFEVDDQGEQESLITARQLRAARAALTQKEASQ